MHSKGRKLVTTLFIILLAFSIVAASGGRTIYLRLKTGQDSDLQFGRAGLYFSSSQYTGTVAITRSSSGNAPGEEKPAFTQKFINVRLYKDDDTSVKHVVGPVYIYFKVRQAELKQYNNGNLSIYYWDTWLNKWTECRTMLVMQDKTGKNNRLACRITVLGLYGLGMKR